jgi:hypothetical protein
MWSGEVSTIARAIKVILVPIMLLNWLGGLVSGVWLALLGDWSPIAVGIAAMFVSHILLGIAFLPALALFAPAMLFFERGRGVLAGLFLAASQAYQVAIIALWCVGVLLFFASGAAPPSIVPRLIWSYGVALGPIMYMAQKEQRSGGAEGTVFATLVAQVAYVVTIVAALLLSVTVLQGAMIFTGITVVGAAAQFLFVMYAGRMEQFEKLKRQQLIS